MVGIPSRRDGSPPKRKVPNQPQPTQTPHPTHHQSMAASGPSPDVVVNPMRLFGNLPQITRQTTLAKMQVPSWIGVGGLEFMDCQPPHSPFSVMYSLALTLFVKLPIDTFPPFPPCPLLSCAHQVWGIWPDLPAEDWNEDAIAAFPRYLPGRQVYVPAPVHASVTAGAYH